MYALENGAARQYNRASKQKRRFCMEIEILQQQCGGTEFVPRPHRLHLGAQKAEGVDQLHFALPDAWAGCSLALYLRRRDGTQLAPIPLDTDNCVTVDRRLTGSVGGQWMLAAVRGDHYTAYTRPGSYDVYATLPTDGGSEDLPPSLYEQFVARVLESAQAAAASARKAEAGAADTARQAELAQSAADKILADRTDAADCAARAEAAAIRAESYAPTDGTVLSVNSKGGAVWLNAQDVNAVPCPAAPTPGEVVRILSLDAATGAVRTDTTALPDLRPYLRSDAVPTAEAPGAVRVNGQYGIAVRSDGTLTTAPATAAQLDRMTEAYAPLTPALLPYGVKQALTSAAKLAEWSAQEKSAALLQLGADERFYPRTEADQKFGAPYTLPAATAARLGGIRVGTGLTVHADGTLELTEENINTVLGCALADKLNHLERMMNMDGKLVYTATARAGKTAQTLTVPENVDYIVVQMMERTRSMSGSSSSSVSSGSSTSAPSVAVAADYGSTRIVRGGEAVALVGGPAWSMTGGVSCGGISPVTVRFAQDGTLSIGSTGTSDSEVHPFNVEGYQYV